LAFHYARAENWERALQFMLDAGEQSNRMAADDEALLHYEEAVATYTRVFGDKWETQQRATIELRLGEIHLRRGSPAQALRHLTAVLALYGETIPESRMAIRIATVREGLIQILHRALPVLMIKELRDPVEPAQETLIRTFELLAWTTAMMDTAQLVVTVFKVLNRAERFGSASGVTKGSAAFSHGLDVLGFPRLGGVYARWAIRVAEKTSNLSAKGLAWHLNGIHGFHVGRWDDALAWFDKGRQLAEQSGDLSTWSNASIFKCELLSETGAFEEVLVISKEMITRGRESAYEPAHRWGLTAGGKALRRLGRIDECEPTLREAAELCLRTSDFINLGPNQAELACCLVQRGRYEEATAILDECNRAMTEHRILAHTVVWVQTARALVAIVALELSGGRDRVARREANRRCKHAYRTGEIFAVGLPSSMRLRGTLAWLEGRSRGAEYWWNRSLQTAEKLGASYQSGLTLVERGRRRKAADDLRRGTSILVALGIEARMVERYPLL
jgi:tetratricopeptide (TPR) repeat protein